MSGRHSWSTLLERTFTPEERAEIAREGAKIAADNRRRRSPGVDRGSLLRPTPAPPSGEARAVAPKRGLG